MDRQTDRQTDTGSLNSSCVSAFVSVVFPKKAGQLVFCFCFLQHLDLHRLVCKSRCINISCKGEQLCAGFWRCAWSGLTVFCCGTA